MITLVAILTQTSMHSQPPQHQPNDLYLLPLLFPYPVKSKELLVILLCVHPVGQSIAITAKLQAALFDYCLERIVFNCYVRDITRQQVSKDIDKVKEVVDQLFERKRPTKGLSDVNRFNQVIIRVLSIQRGPTMTR